MLGWIGLFIFIFCFINIFFYSGFKEEMGEGGVGMF